MSSALILYGPPAVGKDTINRELEKLDPQYAYFPRLKTGSGNLARYRQVNESELGAMRERGEILYSNNRYDATYAVDRPHLSSLIEQGLTPVVHLGQTAGIEALVKGYPTRWLVVGLWCSRSESTRRLKERSDDRLLERLQAWDMTLSDLRSADPGLFSLKLNTEVFDPHESASLIDSALKQGYP